MLLNMRQIRRMMLTTTADEASLSYRGAVARLAEVHHYGEVDSVDQAGKIQTQYPARPLLGISGSDISMIRKILEDSISRVINR